VSNERKIVEVLAEARAEIDGLPAQVKDIFDRNRQLRMLADAQEQGRDTEVIGIDPSRSQG